MPARSWHLPFAVIVATLFCGTLARSQDSELTTLLARSPRKANAMAYLHVPSLKKLIADANMTRQLNDELQQMWLISEFDTVGMRPIWEAGYATLSSKVSADSLAKIVGGYVDTIGDRQVVWSPRQAYLVPVGDHQLGFLRPANRRLASDWISSSGDMKATSFLTEHAAQPEKFLSFMIAFDLRNAFSPVNLSKRLASFDSLKSVDQEAVTREVASIQGVNLIVGRKSLSECILSVEFAMPPQATAAVAAPFLNEVLNRNGTSVPEVLNWTSTVKGNTVSFRGAITEDTLDSLLGIFSLQSQVEQVVQSTAEMAESASASSSGPNAAASKKYFDQVHALIEKVRRYSAQTSGYRAQWNDQQARKIDELGTLHVDPVLVAYGTDVADLLRGNALTIRTGNIEAGATKAEQGLIHNGYYGSDSGSYVYYDPNTSLDYQRVTGAKARAAASSDYRTTLSNIDKISAAVRKAMTDKYNIQF